MKDTFSKEQKKEVRELFNKYSELYYQRRDLNYSFFEQNGLLEDEEFKVGEWIYLTEYDHLFKVTRIAEGKVYGHGFIDSEWIADDDEPWINTVEKYRKSTDKEVEEALKREGDKLIGKTVKCLGDGREYIIKCFNCINILGSLWYYSNNNIPVCLMKDGKWAEVISEPKEEETFIDRIITDQCHNCGSLYSFEGMTTDKQPKEVKPIERIYPATCEDYKINEVIDRLNELTKNQK